MNKADPLTNAPSDFQQVLPKLVITALLCCAPVFALLSIRDFGPPTVLNGFGLPIILTEILVIVCALISNPKIVGSLARLRPLTKIGAALWLAAAMIANYHFATDRVLSTLFFPFTLVHFVFAWALAVQLSGPWKSNVENMLVATALGAAVFFVIAYVWALANRNTPGYDWLAFGIAVNNVRHLAGFALTILGLAAGFYCTAQSPRHRLMSAGLLLLGMVFVLWSGSRAASLAAIAALSVTFILCPPDRRKAFVITALGCLVLAVPLAAAFVPSAFYGPFNFVEGASTATADVNTYSSNRIGIWIDTLEWIQQSPLFGHGDGQFVYPVGGFRHPHNTILQFLYEWGFAGLLGICLMASGALWKIRAKVAAQPKVAIPAVTTFTALLATSMLDGSFHFAFPIMVGVLMLASLASIEPNQS